MWCRQQRRLVAASCAAVRLSATEVRWRDLGRGTCRWLRAASRCGDASGLHGRALCTPRFFSSSSDATPPVSPDESHWMAADLFDELAPRTVSRAPGGDADTVAEGVPFTPANAMVRDDGSSAQQRRRRRYEAAERLSAVVAQELRAEVERDSREGVAAIPPLAPPGWNVQHHPGTRVFTMTRFISGRSRRLAKEVTQQQLELGDTASNEGPRFRSIHEEHQRRQSPRGSSRQMPRTQTVVEPSSATFATAPHGPTPRLPLSHVARSDVTLTLIAPFRVQDLSLTDPNVAISEYTRFDLLVRKEKPSELSTDGGRLQTVQGQTRLWEDGQCMYLSLASANSELRLRGVQLLSRREARTLERYAFYGEGDAVFRELLERQGAIVRRRRAHVLNAPLSSAEAMQSSSDFVEPSTRRQFAQGDGTAEAVWRSGDNDDSSAEALLTREAGYVGSVARRLCYQGPYVTELSRELREALMQYVAVDLGVHSVLVEYVNQMLFFVEQEEYMRWLARLGHMSSALQKRS